MKYKRKKTNVSKYISLADDKDRKRKIKKSSFKKRLTAAAVLVAGVLSLSRFSFVNSSVLKSVFTSNSKGNFGKAVDFFDKTGRTLADLCLMILKNDDSKKTSAFAENEAEAESDGEINSDSAQPEANESVFMFAPTNPCPGRISSDFGERVHPLNNEVSFHNGLDIAVESGTEIRACFDGVVETSEYNEFSGNYIIINHSEGYTSSYAHMSELFVQKGKEVKKGEVIGLSGSSGNATGPHLHFEIRLEGTPLNPTELIGKNNELPAA